MILIYIFYGFSHFFLRPTPTQCIWNDDDELKSRLTHRTCFGFIKLEIHCTINKIVGEKHDNTPFRRICGMKKTILDALSWFLLRFVLFPSRSTTFSKGTERVRTFNLLLTSTIETHDDRLTLGRNATNHRMKSLIYLLFSL